MRDRLAWGIRFALAGAVAMALASFPLSSQSIRSTGFRVDWPIAGLWAVVAAFLWGALLSPHGATLRRATMGALVGALAFETGLLGYFLSHANWHTRDKVEALVAFHAFGWLLAGWIAVVLGLLTGVLLGRKGGLRRF